MENAVLVLPAVIVGLVEVVKRTNVLDTKFLPLLNVLLGLVGGLVFIGVTPLGALQGIILGLAAGGFYDLGKEPVTKGVKEVKKMMK